jgi:hypothetical protein
MLSSRGLGETPDPGGLPASGLFWPALRGSPAGRQYLGTSASPRWTRESRAGRDLRAVHARPREVLYCVRTATGSGYRH